MVTPEKITDGWIIVACISVKIMIHTGNYAEKLFILLTYIRVSFFCVQNLILNSHILDIF